MNVVLRGCRASRYSTAVRNEDLLHGARARPVSIAFVAHFDYERHRGGRQARSTERSGTSLFKPFRSRVPRHIEARYRRAVAGGTTVRRAGRLEAR